MACRRSEPSTSCARSRKAWPTRMSVRRSSRHQARQHEGQGPREADGFRTRARAPRRPHHAPLIRLSRVEPVDVLDIFARHRAVLTGTPAFAGEGIEQVQHSISRTLQRRRPPASRRRLCRGASAEARRRGSLSGCARTGHLRDVPGRSFEPGTCWMTAAARFAFASSAGKVGRRCRRASTRRLPVHVFRQRRRSQARRVLERPRAPAASRRRLAAGVRGCGGSALLSPPDRLRRRGRRARCFCLGALEGDGAHCPWSSGRSNGDASAGRARRGSPARHHDESTASAPASSMILVRDAARPSAPSPAYRGATGRNFSFMYPKALPAAGATCRCPAPPRVHRHFPRRKRAPRQQRRAVGSGCCHASPAADRARTGQPASHAEGEIIGT